MKKLLPFIVICILAVSCSEKLVPGNVVKFLSAEDEAVLELLAGLKKNPSDKSLLELLPDTYQRAMDSRMAMKSYVLRDNPPGDRWVYWRKQLEASQSITDAVLAFPQASAVISRPVQFRDQISDARQQAAEEYYQSAMELLGNGNRRDARMAIDYLNKANREVNNFRDVAQQIRLAEEKATLFVVVNPVDYYNFGWNYWGFQNDYLQWQMIQDLNRRSYNYTRFITDRDAYAMRLKPERVVDMRFSRLQVYNPYTERNSYTREKTIMTPEPRVDTSRMAPPRGSITVRATVTVTKRLVNGDADLECRIYDVEHGRNILYDRFPGRYNWVFESATYTGDSRALTDADWKLINNRFDRYPTREEVAQRLIQDAYGALIRRIEQGVNFDPW
ncbi:MAG: hypothetical protein MUE71_03445 [Chitinophagaceae bacterium]|nr:hypothetical protein [Chitinophagaceae bacterium]MCU0403510.1 hypothetical protein [Chitinophagaceae bacterium]